MPVDKSRSDVEVEEVLSRIDKFESHFQVHYANETVSSNYYRFLD